jgi:hypothetical protein
MVETAIFILYSRLENSSRSQVMWSVDCPRGQGMVDLAAELVRNASIEYASAYHDGKVWLFDFGFVELYTNFELVGKLGDCVLREGNYSRF